MKRIVLASGSPYRKSAFEFLKIPFECIVSDVDESVVSRERPESLVPCLAKMKAEAVAGRLEELGESAVVIGMDSVGFMNGVVLEKPKSKSQAFLRLKAMSGNSIQFFTGVHVIDMASGVPASKVVKTGASLRMLSDKEIERYLETDPNYMTYALGVDFLSGIGATFVRELSGSHNNILYGCPIEEIPRLLKTVGCDIESMYE